MRLLPKIFKPGLVLSLRTKFLVGILILQCLTMTGTILIVERQMRESILEEFLKLGMAISKNLSAVNASFVTTYNYVGIEQNVTQAVKENDLAYALIQFFDGEIAAYRATTCSKCNGIVVTGDAGDEKYPDKCPACGYSAVEERVTKSRQ